MRKRSISIINTGIQLINVIEAIKYTGCTENYLIIGQFNVFPDRIKQIEKMLEDDFLNCHFKKIYSLPKQFSPNNPFRFLGYIAAYLKFINIILFTRKFDYCFSGVYTDLMQRPINFLSYYRNNNINLWLVDEGVRIIADVKLRKSEIERIQKQEKRKKLWLRDFYLGFTKKWYPPKLAYFSAYNLSVLNNDNLIANNYTFFKTNNIYKYNFEPNAVIVIGQPLIEIKMLSEEKYNSLLQKIISANKNFPIYYVPHPMEVLFPKFLPANVEIIKTQYPIELLLLGAKISSLIGFLSSVLINAVKMNLCNDIQSYTISPEDKLTNINSNASNELLELFKKVNIRLMN